MDTDRFRQDVIVATAAAGSTVALSLIFEFGLEIEPSFFLQAAPLGVYFLHVFGHSFLPDSVDRPRYWVGLALAVAVVAFVIATL
ncbi:hypothetical protein EGH24_11330 [Halonotius terrestris]|uniref:DUF8049 domain-containing protein n=1 Tax=Halonotius terrestris TaxID=2487750 RepID=A0A8J8P8C0_9EURY|nr:hypothetical protein [Halonotius terrestris]TQQ79220.1 hypothetical protein EGH24_11330 [Halonotius terrestris]